MSTKHRRRWPGAGAGTGGARVTRSRRSAGVATSRPAAGRGLGECTRRAVGRGAEPGIWVAVGRGVRLAAAVGVAVVLGAGLAGTAPLAGQAIKVGGQASFGEDSDFGIGPRAQLTLPFVANGIWFQASYDYFFPDAGLTDLQGDFDYSELNINLLGDLPLAGVTNLTTYIGAGLNVTWENVPMPLGGRTSDRLVGANVLGGFRFPLGSMTPFVEGRYELGGGGQLVVAGGVLFP